MTDERRSSKRRTKRKRPDDIRLLLGYTLEEMERMDRAAEEVIRDLKQGRRPQRRQRKTKRKIAHPRQSLGAPDAAERDSAPS